MNGNIFASIMFLSCGVAILVGVFSDISGRTIAGCWLGFLFVLMAVASLSTNECGCEDREELDTQL